MPSRPTLIVLGVALAYFVVLWVSAPSVGYTRDEGYYFKAAEEYAGWWGVLFSRDFTSAFSDATILKYFNYNHEHPPLVKLTQGLTYHLFHGLLGVASPAQGFRVAGFLFASLSVVATYLLGRALVSARVGVVAAILLTAIPRYFFDAHLACFDVPITAMWTLSIFFFVRAYRAPPEKVVRFAVEAGLVWGLGLATKLNALFLPAVFVFLWFIAPPESLRPRLLRNLGGGLDVRLPRIPLVLVACALIGPVVFVVTWPYLWHDTFLRIGTYIGFHLHHEHYPISYFHQLLVKPPFPWGFPIVMSAVTVPGPIFGLGVIGFVVATVRTFFRRSFGDATLFAATALPVFLIAMPDTPIFGGVKHWYNAMPSLSILAATALFWGVALVRDLMGQSAGRLAVPVAVALAALPGYLGAAHTHPNGIGYYNALAGGIAGGAELGMQRGFWGYMAYPLYPELGERMGARGRVFFNRTNYDSYRMYQREGVIPQTIYYANYPKGADAGVSFEQPEHAEKEGELWSVMGTRPVDGVYQDNVTLIQLYQVGPSAEPPSR
ncbi:MAG: glycosyltransferase family 39 protein [Myxococcales bacterium]|nr:glycosyltransferase family 39 protein [Myxococcales bacterium]